VVVELIGGDEPAHTLTAAALAVGKDVVTANKHVLAHYGAELEAIARRTGASLRFEAAVGGGIPLLGPLGAELAGNRIRRVRGILNGTTNYILSAMGREGLGYEQELAAAQAAGYAEADPRGDVEGDDAVNKLVILTRLAFGVWLEPASIPRRPPRLDGPGRPGIVGVTAEEMAAAATLGLTLRLLASASRVEEGGIERIRAAVVPTAVPMDGPFGQTVGVINRVEVDGEPLGRVAFSGPGAGGGPTNSAVLGDLLAVARGVGSTWAGLPPAQAIHPDHPATGRATGGAAEDGIGSGGWFAFLPRVQPLQVRSGTAGLYAVAAPGGTAIRSLPVPIESVRASVADLLDAPGRVTLYPIDD